MRIMLGSDMLISLQIKLDREATLLITSYA